MVAGGQQEALEAFDKFVTARQMRPGSVEVEKLRLDCAIARLLGAPLAVRGAVVTLCDLVAQPLNHRTPTISIILRYSTSPVNFYFDPGGLCLEVLIYIDVISSQVSMGAMFDLCDVFSVCGVSETAHKV